MMPTGTVPSRRHRVLAAVAEAAGPDRRIARLVINTRIEHEYSGDWSAMSAWHFDDGKDMSGHEAVVTPGYGPMAEHLAQGLDLRLGAPVLGIAPCADGVEVTTTRGTHRAGHAIVTLPLGVLQSGRVAFGEPLAPARQRAIDSLGMGLLNKCVLRFDRVFWPPEVDWIDFLGPTETLWADWTSYLRATGRPLLAAFNAARMADEVEGWDDRDTTASAMEALRVDVRRRRPRSSRQPDQPLAAGPVCDGSLFLQGSRHPHEGPQGVVRHRLGRAAVLRGRSDIARLSGHGPWGTDDRKSRRSDRVRAIRPETGRRPRDPLVMTNRDPPCREM